MKSLAPCRVHLSQSRGRAFPYLFPGSKSSKEGLIALSRAWCNCSGACDIECKDNQLNSMPGEVKRFVATVDWKERFKWWALAALFIGQDCIDVFIVPDKNTHTHVTNTVFVDRGAIFAVFVDLLL